MQEKNKNIKKKSLLLTIVEYVKEKREELENNRDDMDDFWEFIANRPYSNPNIKKPLPRELTKEELEEAKIELYKYLDDPEHIEKKDYSISEIRKTR